jgi:hypothetical protein
MGTEVLFQQDKYHFYGEIIMTRDVSESALVIEKELDRLLTQVELDNFLARVSQVMEIYEMFDNAAAAGLEYGQGYQDGFWAGRELDAKYQLAKVEIFLEKSKAYSERHRY